MTYPEWLEEPLALARHVTLLKLLLNGCLGLFTGFGSLEGIRVETVLERLKLVGVTCGEEVRVVDDLNNNHSVSGFDCKGILITYFYKRLDLCPPLHLLLVHTLRDFERVALNASDESEGVFALLVSVVQRLHNDNLLARMSPLEYDAHLSWLVDYLYHLSDQFK